MINFISKILNNIYKNKLNKEVEEKKEKELEKEKNNSYEKWWENNTYQFNISLNETSDGEKWSSGNFSTNQNDFSNDDFLGYSRIDGRPLFRRQSSASENSHGLSGFAGSSGFVGPYHSSSSIPIISGSTFQNCNSLSSIDLNPLISYTEYIAENLNKSINYTEYIAENLDKSIKYSEYTFPKPTKTREIKRIYTEEDPYGEEDWSN